MSIVSFNTLTPGLVGVAPRIVQFVVTDNLATVTAAGYFNEQGNVLQGFAISPTDEIHMIYSYNVNTGSGTFGIFFASISAGQITLTEWVNSADVLLPVVSGDFAIFNGTAGQIKDAGYLPSNAAKTKVVMANGTTIANHIATYADVNGTIGEDSATAINGGNLQAGLTTGTAGTLISCPSAGTSGELIVAAVTNSSGNFNTTISNASAVGQSQVVSIPDSGVATAQFLLNNNRASAANSTITVAAGAANTCNVTIQLKDSNGNNISTVQAFQLYSSDSASGIGLTSTAASTGYSMTSGGGVAALTGSITKNLFCVSSATGGAVVALLDTAKTAYRIVLVLFDGIVVSSAATYG